MSHFYPLKILEVRQETPHSVSIVFEIPESLKDAFRFKAGQYLTIKHSLNGQEIRRSYSLCSAPNSGEWRIAIKKVDGGGFSSLANTQLQKGDVLEVMPPQGHFLLQTDSKSRNHYLAMAAGSGITPIMAMIKAVLTEEAQSTFTLFYGNQSRVETMFLETLKSLEAQYPERFSAQYFFSQESVEDSYFGRIERSTLLYLLKHPYKNVAFDAYYLCGPEEMIAALKFILLERGAKESTIHFELFTSKETGSLSENHTGKTLLTVTLDNDTETFAMPKGKSVLEAVLEHGLDAPYSCQGGICSSCMAKLKVGKVEMLKNQILTDSELEQGYILTCQSHPTTPSISVDYDDL
ncbi:MAG TPA: ferredoxin--NADP reductase [Flavobacteriaceae bacterium]|nr:ferredoxin--NADP reductase [Flavobacteriaceae bacterium]MCB9211904.1 ferredoxin--NADP reductase [Alteromonas sp.]HPF10002.1 ferredoxin--NADP reductase [Flavobacteriaceae bacterium]HQU22358.1 ferredoxin--NADP reductase [Flavobacteriaceae bacterium]HQU63915.1 ferredoxin--NADP reductase [Flavobacteriaceae bacterium]